MKKAAIYLHGKGGSAEEAAHYAPLFPECTILGADYRAETPWAAKAELSAYFAELAEKYDSLTLIANSIGAYFAMCSGADRWVQRAYFISPIVDMEALIMQMLSWSGHTEAELRERGEIATDFGETLSWAYLSYVRENPISWRAPTEILYGGKDHLTSCETMAAFATAHGAGLTVMPDGEHWFHTPEQMRFLDTWLEGKMEKLIIRAEKEEDYRAVENLVRESFWNVYRPGCSEHYVIHVLRNDPAFVKELDFVMEKDGKLIGQNMFMRTVIEADDGSKIDVLTMGPICIAPEWKRKGYGKKLLDYSLQQAAKLGFGAVLFEGNIGFYGNCGFDYASKFGIRYHDLPEGADASFFLCKELTDGYLDGVTGVYQTPQGYYVDDADVEAFDKQFPPKKKEKLPGQIFG